MSHDGHFPNKWIKQDKLGRAIKTHEDFRTARIRHSDGTHADYRDGKMVPGTHVETSNKKPKKDVASGESKFYKPTEVSTIVAKQKDGETDTAGEAETV